MRKDHMMYRVIFTWFKNFFFNVSVICDILLLWCIFCKNI